MVHFRATVTIEQETPHWKSFLLVSVAGHGSWSGQNDNEDVPGTVSKAFTRWLHHRYAPVELPSAGMFRRAIPRYRNSKTIIRLVAYIRVRYLRVSASSLTLYHEVASCFWASYEPTTRNQRHIDC